MISSVFLPLFKLLSTALAIVTLMILCPFAVLAQVLPGVAPLELIVSFLPQILLISGIAVIALAVHQRRLALLATPIVLITAVPFLFLSKHETPSGGPCAPEECLTVITANIFGLPDAMLELGSLAEAEGADIVAINESVRGAFTEDYRRAFPQYARVTHGAGANRSGYWGSSVTLLSRLPFEQTDRILEDNTGGRAYIVADLGPDWQDLRIVVAHAMTPLRQRQLNQRNQLMRETGAALRETETFILMGDFNLTPWSPTFRRLPGKRAGDPRLSNTWPTFAPLLGISIDHIMFDGDLELVEFRVLPSVGSDHYPVLARFRRPSP